MFKYVHHVDYVVRSLDEVVAYLERNFGMTPERLLEDAMGYWKGAEYHVGKISLEFKEPMPGTEYAQFLEKHGPGVRHIAWGVDNIAQAAQELTAKGITLRPKGDSQDRPGYHDINIDVKDSLGIRFQLVEESE